MEPIQVKTPAVNYIYFGFYFLLISLMSANGILTKSDLSGSRVFFLLYSTGQAALETSLMILLCSLAYRYIGKKTFYLLIGASFLLFLFHTIDFFLSRIFDLSIWSAISLFIIDESLDNFIYLLEATGLPLGVWVFLFLSLALLPFLGILLYRLTDAIAQKKPYPFRPERWLIASFCLPAALLFWDYSAARALHPDAYTAFLQALPWKSTFLQPTATHLTLPGSLKKPPTEESIAKHIETFQDPGIDKPNIYLFVIESLRRDVITEEIAPNLSAFQAQAAALTTTYSNGNGSHLSWFSIFHSQQSYLWSHLQNLEWSMGSPPLALLKKLGYQVRVYTSAELNYYGMGTLLFGKQRQLIDAYHAFAHIPPKEAADSDAEALEQLQRDLENNPALRKGQIFIIFWDATHFNYSWPKRWPPKFHPFAKELAYFKALFSSDPVDLIKNRYKNAVHYIDELFKKFIHALPDREEALIVVTGDHAEEFLEQGHLFHNSHISKEQTHIPLIMKLGKKSAFVQDGIVSQVDIFPSLLDALGVEPPAYLEGRSILRRQTRPFAIISRFNAGRSPYEFCIHTGSHKLIAHFPNHRNIFLPGELHIRSVRTEQDKMLPETSRDVKQWIQTEFGDAIEYLFNDKIINE